jgi:glyoxylase-like metal-dependent hydrolase (beta-lactamase superfamily II)
MKIELIEIKLNMPGFNGFIGPWVCRDDINFIVDVGPANTSDQLIRSLRSMGVDRLDLILLTHIHIDHAGALADILKHYPTARVVCHENGLKFLVDPSKLWEGSLKVLGETARIYGEPKPAQTEMLTPHTLSREPDLLIIETPGHAPHHLSFSYKKHLFAGEAGGNYFRIGDTEYIRPATPPRLFLDVFLSSLDRMIALENQPIFYAHFGRATDSRQILSRFREQVLRWRRIIHEEIGQGETDLVQRCLARLLETDADLRGFDKMDADQQAREKTFLVNSINGFIGFLQENP